MAQVKMAYFKEGQGDPILLLHGIPTSSYLWRKVAPILAEHFTVYAPDLIGYGRSDKPENADLSIPAQTLYVKQFLENHRLEGAIVVGHDLGGGIAQWLAVRHPKLVSRLVLINSVCYDCWPASAVEKYKQPEWDDLILGFDLEARLRSVLRRGFYRRDLLSDEELEGYIEPFRGEDGRRAYLRCARAVSNLDTLAIAPHLKNINVETLILWGENDQFLGIKNGRRLETDIRLSRLVPIPEAGHFCPDEKAPEVARLILNFAR